jgi:hypothetical protein
MSPVRGDRRTPRPYSRAHVAVFVAVWAVLCAALHFGGLAYGVYTRYWWWDLLTHTLSGFGVAGVAYVLRPSAFDSRRLAYLAVPAAVLAVGAGFEVYEYLFKDFYVGWSRSYYATDTALDLALDALGAAAFGLLARPALRGPSEPAAEPTPARSGGPTGAD